ncbi:3-isopropylmalate/(R)-2-methylmalate dehydratase large subunit [Paenibacillus jamilae]|jgi:3-isopropylmalate/(R)-2-methylmalate dehydratase large subunit|nr:aconitase/3-isopropylmalate dehydratase large subunit family protein [Paenibacillus polymyxa]MDP9678240.1 3-isopropylmalate/(R)-2-methylmalate dehydratase large subunit [Paenibacillus jamilae]MBY0024308.1 3-isopropylmalate dehydratase large subunit [Paenibacillus polymyxa]MBY0059734.1 3-isopropylmalate dehydratase large subunit [Paenibacillus polymyxa]MBY0069925.1 3-isopropylmalate dehydratase large subunit [Paenibacillus polymyxa]MBY0082033.1 3-isopropylmalate dehydratase large subunit [Pa
MGHTLAEKLLMKNTGEQGLAPGDIVIARPDRYMIHDIYTSFLKRALKDMHVTKAIYPDRGVIIFDHLMPTNQADTDPAHFVDGLELAEKFQIKNVHKGEGICHSLMHELRYARPGEIVVATDSHTTTYGGAGCFCTGIGHTEMAAVVATGEIWLKVPSAIKIVLDGEFPKGVGAKDIILRILGDIKSDGGQYKSMEFTGAAVRSMSMQSRFTIANMALEAGAKVGLFEADEKTAEYYDMDYNDISWLKVDEDAKYEQVLHYDVSKLEPQLSCPQGVDNVHPISEIEGTKLNQVYIGSCTNGSIEDMETAAKILEGKKIAPFLKMIVIPATINVYKEAMERGYIQTFIDAGASVSHPCCGLCCGQPYGLMSDDEVVLGTNNRNFIGRMGTKKSLIYLSSPAVAAASALTGVITHPAKQFALQQ